MQQLHQQPPQQQQQQLPHSGQLLGQPGQLYQPTGQLPPAQERPMYEDHFSAVTPERQEPIYQPAIESQTYDISHCAPAHSPSTGIL